MCFIEYLGYTCGHTSLSVLRTCPQTTGIPTNPVCKKPAERPQLMSSFCVPCAHIQHKRWSDIAEQEHRWMHERGVCGCPVQFPDLMQPRMVVGGGRRGNHGVMNADGTTCTIVGSGDITRPNDSHGYHHHYGSGNGYGKKSNKRGGKNWRRGGGGGGGGGHHHHHSHNPQTNRAQQQKDEYPALQEIREGDDVRYAVRLPSTYGVEWAWDHEKVHREGKCSCDVRFDKYVPQYNLPNTQYSLVQGSPESAATASGNQTYNAATSNNDFLVTRPFEQSPAQPSTQSSFTTQSSTAQSSEAQSSMQSWVQPFMQSSEQQQQQQQQQHRYGQTSATQAFGIQQGYPQYSTQNVAPPQSSSEQHSGSTGSGGLRSYAQDHHHHHNNSNNNTQQATFGQPFTPGISQTMMTTGADAFSQTMPDSITDLFAQQPDNSNAAPSVTSSSYAIPRVPIDSDSMAAAWNLSQPQRWTCNPPAGFYNDQQVYLPPPLPTTTTTNTTNTNKINATRLPIAHGTNTAAAAAAAAASNNKNNNNDKGKAKANAANDNDMTIRGGGIGFSSNANANADEGNGNGSGGGPGGYGGFGCPARPVDMQTMWFSPSQEHDAQAPLVGYPIGMGPEGPDGSLQVPGQIYQHAKTGDAIPLNGFPIGAGPEGDAHAGSFEECELYYHRGGSSGSVGREGRDGHSLRRTGSSSF